ncbi:pirin family protein [Hymenobacter saemangeumensis]|uniref:Pirin family protein n=1 Tax=Hymenobacter saemangeumensis TaxID=1084522 RepID=A0ABP8I9T4_9BACT
MKYILRKNEDRWHKQDSWKKSAYAFVPYQTNFGELCGFAEDVVAGGQGFGLHPHQNMEITTIVTRGSQRHQDSTGGESVIDASAVQTMSAGTGIRHSEFNASATEAVHGFQIWVYPKKADVVPRYQQFRFRPEEKRNRILLAISPDEAQGAVAMNQDACFSLSELEAGHSVRYRLRLPDAGVYIHCVSGAATVAGETLGAGDAIGVYETDEVAVSAAASGAELIYVEVLLQRGITL